MNSVNLEPVVALKHHFLDDAIRQSMPVGFFRQMEHDVEEFARRHGRSNKAQHAIRVKRLFWRLLEDTTLS